MLLAVFVRNGVWRGGSGVCLRKISQAGKFRGEMNDERGGKKDPAGGIVNGAQFAGIGIQFVVLVLLGLYGGRWLDGRFHTPPLFLVIGTFVGAGAGIWNMYRALAGNTR
jgi:F0F1-type ATP synthase assembly protein I